MDRGKISVIIPVYNVATDLSRCLDSVLAQTYKNLEIIAVNDGSTDNSGEILERYAAEFPQIKAIHQTNGGVTTARLHGVALSSGDWIGFVDGDDEIESDMYEHLLKNALKYHADISHCGYQMVFSDGRVNYFHNSGRIVQQDNAAGLKDLLDGSMIEPGLCNKLFHKTLFYNLLQDNLMDLSIKINEDLLMNFYLFLQAEKSVFEDFCPYHYIVRSTSVSRQKINKNKIFDPIRVRKAILQLVPDDLSLAAKKAYINSCLNACNCIILAGFAEKKEYKVEFEQVCDLLASEKVYFSLIGKKRKYMAKAVLWIPGIYGVLYRIYVRYFQKKVYD